MNMSAELFIQYFKINMGQSLFYFGPFFKECLASPTSVKIKNNDDTKNIARQIRNVFLINLAQNDWFLKNDGFCQSDAQKIFNLLLGTRNDLDQHQIAQLILLNNLSNSNFESVDDFHIFVNGIPTIFVLSNEPTIVFENEFTQIFEMLKKSQVIKKKIFDAIKQICEIKEFDYDMSRLKLTFFSTDIVELSAFAGVDTIYSNNKRYEVYLREFKLINFNEERILKIFKLNFVGIFVNLTSYIVLRSLKDNFNESSKSLKVNLLELGVRAEEKLFTQRITWFDSAFCSSLDIDYCFEFIEKILDNQDVDFNFYKTHSLLNSERNKYLAIDYENLEDELF